MAEQLRNLTQLLFDGATIKVEAEIIEQLKEELTSFECLMCCKGFESFEEFQQHQDEHRSQCETLQVYILVLLNVFTHGQLQCEEDWDMLYTTFKESPSLWILDCFLYLYLRIFGRKVC